MHQSVSLRNRCLADEQSLRPEPIRRQGGPRLLLDTSKHVKHQRLRLHVVNKGLGDFNGDLQTQQHLQTCTETDPLYWTAAYVLNVVERQLVTRGGFQRLSGEGLITVVDETGMPLIIMMLKALQDMASCEGSRTGG